MHAPIGVGVIGASPERGWASTVHMPVLLSLPQFRVAAVSTTKQASAEAAAARWHVPAAYADAASLAGDPAVELVVVSVRTPQHYAAVKTALQAGKPVFCEWPLAANSAQARELAALAQAAGVKTAVCVQARMSPVLTYVRDLVAQGFVGEVLSTTMTSASPPWGETTDEANCYLADVDNGATTLSIPGGHTLDALCYCLGEFAEVAAVVATRRPTITVMPGGRVIPKTASDQVLVSGTLESGAVVAAHIQGGVGNGLGIRFEIRGTKGDLVVSSSDPSLIEMATLALHGAQGKFQPLTEMTVPASYTWVPDGAPRGVPMNVAQFYVRLADDLRTGTTTVPDFALAVRRHALLDAIQRASDTGQRQRV